MAPDGSLKLGAVSLLPLVTADVTDRYVSWVNDPEVTAGTELRHGSHTFDDVARYVEQTQASPNDEMWRIMFDEQHVGNIRLSSINRAHKRARIALLIGEKSCWGKGIGTAAITCLTRHAFADLGLHKLTAGIYATNPGSRKAFEKAGYTWEATLMDEAFVDGTFIDVWLMSQISPNEDNQ
jgi:ribosomal-protein-alanine N-acetyltransferase